MGEESPKPPSTATRAVFLSYASEDAEAAERICNALRGAGIEVWFDKSELRGGDAWDRSIREQINECALFVPVISANAHARTEGYFRFEWKLAIDRSHRMAPDQAFLLPVVIDNTPQGDKRIPDRFRELQWTRLPGGHATPASVERVRRLLTRDLPPKPAVANTSAFGVAQTSAPSTRALPGNKTAVWVTGGVVAVVIAYFGVDRFWLTKHPVASSTTNATVAGSLASPVVPENSIAVLPFVDMSDKKDQEYLADGLAEEILDRLAQSPGLKVCGRTSSFQFKHTAASLGDIGKSLNVANVLEGSVRRSGTTLRITTQLIRADTGFHVWSQTYARPLADILKVQEEIAQEVATALGTVLRSASADTQGTSNVEAYDNYLRARAAELRYTRSDVLDARALYRKAIAIDPNYVEAWAGLARAAGISAEFDDPPAGSDAEAREAGDRVLRLAPDSSDAQFALRIRYLASWNWRGLRSADTALLERDPKSASRVGADEFALFGNYARGVALLEDGAERNPLSKWAWVWLCQCYQVVDRLADAEQACRTALSVAPDYEGGHAELAMVLARRGQRDRALQELRLETDKSEFNHDLAYGLISTGDEAARSLQKAFAEAKTMMNKAESQAALGHADEAFAWWYRAIDAREVEAPWIAGDAGFNALRQDARYRTGLRKMNMPEGE